MVKTLSLSLSPALASFVYLVGGGVGQVGHPLGARLANRWGRRPTSLAGSILAVVAGVLFFWVRPGPAELVQLVALMAVSQAATAAFSVSDRLLGVELFLPATAVFALVVPETRRLSLEQAALEEESDAA